MNNQFFSNNELKNLGIRYGRNCKVHKKINITNPENLILGNNVRIDAYCNFVNPKIIKVNSKVHISPYVYLVANGGFIKIITI